VAGWRARRHDPEVLFLEYDDALEDLEGTLRRIADFGGLEIDEGRLDRMLSRCSQASIRRQAARFDITFELLREKGITPGVFIRSGSVGEGKEWLSPEQRGRLDDSLRRRIGMSTGEFRDAPVCSRRDAQTPATT
jgi:aryl sulfotransferase